MSRVASLTPAEVLLVGRALKVYADRRRAESRSRGAAGPTHALYRQALRQDAEEADQLARKFRA